MGAIIGGAVGGVIVVVVLVVVIVLLVKRSNDKNKARNQLLGSNAQLNGGGDSCMISLLYSSLIDR